MNEDRLKACRDRMRAIANSADRVSATELLEKITELEIKAESVIRSCDNELAKRQKSGRLDDLKKKVGILDTSIESFAKHSQEMTRGLEKRKKKLEPWRKRLEKALRLLELAGWANLAGHLAEESFSRGVSLGQELRPDALETKDAAKNAVKSVRLHWETSVERGREVGVWTRRTMQATNRKELEKVLPRLQQSVTKTLGAIRGVSNQVVSSLSSFIQQISSIFAKIVRGAVRALKAVAQSALPEVAVEYVKKVFEKHRELARDIGKLVVDVGKILYDVFLNPDKVGLVLDGLTLIGDCGNLLLHVVLRGIRTSLHRLSHHLQTMASHYIVLQHKFRGLLLKERNRTLAEEYDNLPDIKTL